MSEILSQDTSPRKYGNRPPVRSKHLESEAKRQRQNRAVESFFRTLAEVRLDGNEATIARHFDRFCQWLDDGPVLPLETVFQRAGRTNRSQCEAREALTYGEMSEENLHRYVLETRRDIAGDLSGLRSALAALAKKRGAR